MVFGISLQMDDCGNVANKVDAMVLSSLCCRFRSASANQIVIIILIKWLNTSSYLSALADQNVLSRSPVSPPGRAVTQALPRQMKNKLSQKSILSYSITLMFQRARLFAKRGREILLGSAQDQPSKFLPSKLGITCPVKRDITVRISAVGRTIWIPSNVRCGTEISNTGLICKYLLDKEISLVVCGSNCRSGTWRFTISFPAEMPMVIISRSELGRMCSLLNTHANHSSDAMTHMFKYAHTTECIFSTV